MDREKSGTAISMTVSYTHLDVYKRQVHTLMDQLDAVGSQTEYYPNGTVKRLVLDSGKIGQHNPVSYTHLDVYKRQVLPILRDQEELYKGAETFFDFEDDTWELNFFDGRK